MKKSSVFQIVLLASFGALAVAGILIFALATASSNSSAIGPVVIWGTLDQAAVSAVLRQAADTDANFNQVSYIQKDAATYESDLTEALADGKGPDLFIMRQDRAYQDAGKAVTIPFSSVSQAQFETAFADAANVFVGTDGIEGLPLAIDPLVLYWNKDLLASQGYAEPPKYWDELYGMAQKLSAKNDAGSLVKSGIAFGEYQNVDHAKSILATLIMQAGGKITTVDDTGKLQSALVPKGSSASSQAAASALRFYTTFADPSKNYYSWSGALPEAQQAFAGGTLALYVGYASEYQSLQQMNPNLNIGVAPLPQIRGANATLDSGRTYALAAARTSKNPAGALSVAATLTSSAYAAPLAEALGMSPARRDLLGTRKTGNEPLFDAMALIVRAWLDPDPTQTDTIFRAMIEDTTSGAVLLDEAVSRANLQLTHLLSQLQQQ